RSVPPRRSCLSPTTRPRRTTAAGCSTISTTCTGRRRRNRSPAASSAARGDDARADPAPASAGAAPVLTPERGSQFLQRFPRVRDLGAVQRAEEAQADQEWTAKEREWQAAAEQAKAEGKPAPRPLKREESKVYRYHGPVFQAPRDEILD